MNKKSKKSKWWDTSIFQYFMLLAGICTVVGFIYMFYPSDSVTPNFKISSTRDDKVNEIDFIIENYDLLIDSFSIDYPLWGVVKTILDLNSSADVETKQLLVSGPDTKNALNNIEIIAENLKPNTSIQYTVKFQNNDFNLADIGIDLNYFIDLLKIYKISYTWEFNGEKSSRTEWRLTSNDSYTTKTPIEYRDLHIVEDNNPEFYEKNDVEPQRRSFLNK